MLRVYGRFLWTWFLLDDETTPCVEQGLSEYAFPFRFESHALRREHAPEHAVAYSRPYLEKLFGKVGLEIEGVYHGGWSGIPNSINSGQDVIVARRNGLISK